MGGAARIEIEIGGANIPSFPDRGRLAAAIACKDLSLWV